ncbi:ZIP family metal transporter [Carbonactinospora thermoautotrophica]|uniref:hypothetical protein n=1 Tax=Carbonactinospora thermoautotrophica TaxID=1469144 RepID=UPI00114664E6|nr:hypothetical protein [Carbonactinospora thermoautotrophica]
MDGPAAGAFPAGVGIFLVAAATIFGAWLGCRLTSRSAPLLGAASGVLMVVTIGDVLPGAVSAATDAGLPLWIIPVLGVIGYVAFGLAARNSCACESDPVYGAGAAIAMAVHRMIEGAALAVIGTGTVLLALLVHATGEGAALAGLLGRSPRRLMPWLVLASASPVIGAWTAWAWVVPASAESVLFALIAGVLLRIAYAAFRTALQDRRPGQWADASVLTAVVVGCAITVMAVTASR